VWCRHTIRERPAYLLAVAAAADSAGPLRRVVNEAHADAVVVDCNLAWVLQTPLETPRAVLVRTAPGLYLPVWQAVLDAANAQGAGLWPAVEAWAGADRVIVASVREFDRAEPAGVITAARYTGPVLPAPAPAEQPAPDGRPTVLVSYSTDPLQNGPERIQTALDGLAALPVRVVAGTSGLFAADRLSVPPHARVEGYLPLRRWMGVAALAVCHAGHGTTMTALACGVPLVCVPGLGRDQAPIAARVAELGLGVALSANATAQDIADAARRVLADPGYRRRAGAFRDRLGHHDGAAAAAEVIEEMV
jgi:Glycosyltransferase family 28 C-terminal domain